MELFDFGVAEQGTFYYVMELLEGLDADALVRRFGPVPAERAVYLLRQVCHSLAEAEARGLVHRDIKPANIFLCRYGEDFDFVKVLDFGLVKALDARTSGDPALTRENAVHGTPAFMAPEQALGEASIDSRADIYATGCVAYWLITGQQVFTAETTDGHPRTARQGRARRPVNQDRAADSAGARATGTRVPRQGSRGSPAVRAGAVAAAGRSGVRRPVVGGACPRVVEPVSGAVAKHPVCSPVGSPLRIESFRIGRDRRISRHPVHYAASRFHFLSIDLYLARPAVKDRHPLSLERIRSFR